MTFSFRQKINDGKPLIGTIQTLAALEVSEIAALAGFDWLFIDMEHSALELQAVQRVLQACGDRLPGIVRVPANQEAWVKRVLDMGAAGIIFPQVNSADEAERIVKMCKYPPEGTRGVGLARAQGYGLQFKEYVASANEQVVVILQVEHIEAVQNLEAIAAVPGIDALFVGPYDLSGSMGRTGQIDDIEVQQQIDYVCYMGRERGIALGIFTANPAEVPGLIDKGYTLITLGIDTMFLARSLQQAIQGIKA